MNMILPITVVLAAVTIASTNAAVVALYRLPEYNDDGPATTLVASKKCSNLVPAWDKKVASIFVESGACIYIYDKSNCAGKGLKLKQHSFGSNDLNDVNLRDAVSSLQLC